MQALQVAEFKAQNASLEAFIGAAGAGTDGADDTAAAGADADGFMSPSKFKGFEEF
jgi:hypothetical protein